VELFDEEALLRQCQARGLQIAERSGLMPKINSPWPCC
jgi:hypothetical protein